MTIQETLFQIQQKLLVPKSNKNDFGGYFYRSAEDILDKLKPLLTDNGCTLIINDDIRQIGDRYYVCATVTLTTLDGLSISAQGFAREEESKKGMDGSQITGSSSSYARKYALCGLFAIDDGVDSDSTNTHSKYEQKPTPSAPSNSNKDEWGDCTLCGQKKVSPKWVCEYKKSGKPLVCYECSRSTNGK